MTPPAAAIDNTHPYPSLDIIGSRRLMGPNIYSTTPGAVLEVVLHDDAQTRLTGWQAAMDELLPRIGWEGKHIVVRKSSTLSFAGLFLSAPVDGLLAATEVNEQAWLAMESALAGHVPDFADVAARLRVSIQHDRQPRLVQIVEAARAHDVSVVFDDELLTLGSGQGAQVWSIARLPQVQDVPWDRAQDVPITLVTGSNGKTTTVRWLAAMLHAAGYVSGWCCTDGVWIDGQMVAEGDYSGPAGARRVLQDLRVGAATLETARGGILRRGLSVDRAAVAIVTNIADDHLGERGIGDLSDLADLKLVVTRVLSPSGRVVLNADDPVLRDRASNIDVPIVWFSLDAANPTIGAHLSTGGDACYLEGEVIVARVAGCRHELGRAADAPLTLGGIMRYNIANGMAASAAALSLGVAPDVVRATLSSFGRAIADNPGRLATFTLNGARILIDFVHNPDGWQALTNGLATLPGRRVVVVGQAGDRDDRALHELAVAVSHFDPTVIILKELPSYLRGRALGETSQLLASTFRSLGFRDAQLRMAPDESQALDLALSEAAPNDLIVIGVHEDFEGATEKLRSRGAVQSRWP